MFINISIKLSDIDIFFKILSSVGKRLVTLAASGLTLKPTAEDRKPYLQVITSDNISF